MKKNWLVLSLTLLSPSLAGTITTVQAQDGTAPNSWWDSPLSESQPQPFTSSPIPPDPAPSPFNQDFSVRDQLNDPAALSESVRTSPGLIPSNQLTNRTDANPVGNSPSAISPAVPSPATNSSNHGQPVADSRNTGNPGQAMLFQPGIDSNAWLPYGGPSKNLYLLQYMQCWNCPPCVWGGYHAERSAEYAKYCSFPQAACNRGGHCGHGRCGNGHCGNGHWGYQPTHCLGQAGGSTSCDQATAAVAPSNNCSDCKKTGQIQAAAPVIIPIPDPQPAADQPAQGQLQAQGAQGDRVAQIPQAPLRAFQYR